jgi:Ca2+-binding EF-hand superfamily protein
MSNKPFVYPAGFDAVAGEFALYFNRVQLKEFAEKFNLFDEDGDSFINFFELKRAQEKLGNPKTHTELTEMMQSMAADPKKVKYYFSMPFNSIVIEILSMILTFSSKLGNQFSRFCESPSKIEGMARG